MANVGGIDRVLRIIIGIAVIAASLYVGDNNLWWILGAVILATGVFRFCGLYKLIGVNTCKLS